MASLDENPQKREMINKIRQMNYEELYDFAEDIRRYMISVISQNGGHLASNLGTVELTLAMYRVFDPFEDYIIWDTGHQSYTHKLLTGRWDRFRTLRTFGGISGFTNIFEDPVDRFGTGHVGTSIAAALGIEKALELEGKQANVVIVIGDGALTSGEALEALNQLKSQNSKIKIILNSNGMSISKNVGSLSILLENLRTNKIYLNIKEAVKRGIKSNVEFELKKVREAVKVALLGQDFFESLGIKHFGPIDGHDLHTLEESLKMLKDYSYPTILTVFTTKGKGYMPSENNPTKYHGVDKFDPDSGDFEKPANTFSYSDVFGNVLVRIAREDPKIVALTAAMPDGTGLKQFSKEFPNRFVDLGITEQSVVTYAGALAMNGFKPVAAIYSTFLQRAYDQIVHDVALQNLNVVFAIDRAGLVGTDGPTHHGIFDIAYMRSIPNMKILTPLNAQDLANTLYFILQKMGAIQGPIAIRYPRDVESGKIDEICGKIDSTEFFSPFRWETLVEGNDVAILAVGTLSREYVEMCQKNNWTLLGVRSVKPFDANAILKIISTHTFIFTVEEGTVAGGFGEGLISHINEHFRDYLGEIRIHNMGICDQFVPQGSRKQLITYAGLSRNTIEEKVKENIRKGVKRV